MMRTSPQTPKNARLKMHAGVAAEEGDLEELEEDDILEMDMSHVAI